MTYEADDVLPRRNLGTAEHWGRTVEKRLENLQLLRDTRTQNSDGLSRQASGSSQFISEMAAQVSAASASLTQAVGIFPHYFAQNSLRTGFGVGADWSTVASILVDRTSLRPGVSLAAEGTLRIYQTPAVTTDFVWPFPLSSVTSEWGDRPPLNYHRGIDFGQSVGTNIPASANGTVILKGYYEDWGNYLRISHDPLVGTSSWTGYAHMVSPSPLSLGASVTQGQTVGQVGETGYTTGPHLHFETAIDGERMNPRTFMDIWGGPSAGTAQITHSRIVINSESSGSFYPLNPGNIQIHRPIFGASLNTTGDIRISLQVRSPTGRFAPDSRNQATLSVIGGIS